MRALIYSRVSTPGQADKYSLDSQVDRCRQLAAELGAEDMMVLEDTHTGSELDRPAMRELRAAVSRGAVDVVIAYDPDRFSRDLGDLLVLTRELEAAGVKLRFVNFEWERSPQGLLFLQLRGAIAQFEHALIRERTARGKRKKAEQGKLRTHAATYGYRFCREQDELVVQPDEARVVRIMFEWYAAGGISVAEVAARLEGDGVSAPQGRRWWPGTVYRILRSETYAGRLRRKDEQPDWLPVLTPQIVDRNLWRRVQLVLADNRRWSSRNNRRYQYLVRGLVVCGLCGAKLRAIGRERRGRVYRYYVCPNRYRRPGTAVRCSALPAGVEEVDTAVWSAVAEQLSDRDLIARWLARCQRRELESVRTRLSLVERSLASLQRARSRAVDALLSGIIATRECEQVTVGCDQRIRVLRSRHARLSDWLAGHDARIEQARVRMGGLLPRVGFEDRQAVIQAVIREGRMMPGAVIELRGSLPVSGEQVVLRSWKSER